MDTVQTNVRVVADDKALIVAIAGRLRADPDFRKRLAAVLADHAGPLLEDRIKKLEQQVSWLLSGAIVIPRPSQRAAATAPTILPKGPPRAQAGHD